MFDLFAKQLGVDPSKFQVVNTATPGLVGYALADRADADPALGAGLYDADGEEARRSARSTPQIAETWKSFRRQPHIPYLGVAAHIDWIEKNQAPIPKLYATYKEAADWVTKHPDEAAALIAPKWTPDDHKALVVADQGQRPARHERACRPARSPRKSMRSIRPASMSATSSRRRRRHHLRQADAMTNSRTMRRSASRRRH